MSGVPHWILRASNEKLQHYTRNALTVTTRFWAKEELARRDRRTGEELAKPQRQNMDAILDYVAGIISAEEFRALTATKPKQQETAPMTTNTTSAAWMVTDEPKLTVTQRPLVQMLNSARYNEQQAKVNLDATRKLYNDRKAERLLIEADLKKIGYKAPVAPKPEKVKKS